MVSNGMHTKTNPPMCKASREYAFFDPQKGVPAANAVPDRTVTLTVKDICGDAATIGAYTEAAPGTPPEQSVTLLGEWFNIGAARAIRHPGEAQGSDRVELLIQRRFLVTFSTKSGTSGGTIERPEAWLAGLNTTALAQAAEKAGKLEISKDYVFAVQRVDEIDPKRNKVLKFGMGGSEPIPPGTN
jgi:hypothetical protein